MPHTCDQIVCKSQQRWLFSFQLPKNVYFFYTNQQERRFNQKPDQLVSPSWRSSGWLLGQPPADRTRRRPSPDDFWPISAGFSLNYSDIRRGTKKKKIRKYKHWHKVSVMRHWVQVDYGLIIQKMSNVPRPFQKISWTVSFYVHCNHFTPQHCREKEALALKSLADTLTFVGLVDPEWSR